MEHGACNVVYIDRRANDEHVRKETLSKSLVARTTSGTVGQSYFAIGKTSPREVHDNVEAILSISTEGITSVFRAHILTNTSNSTHLQHRPRVPTED
jgi:3',5'-cyclic-nucleotide phosphodiesterase